MKSKNIKTKYKYVSKVVYSDSSVKYRMSIRLGQHHRDKNKYFSASGTYTDIRKAAISADLFLIKHGKSPVNILKCSFV